MLLLHILIVTILWFVCVFSLPCAAAPSAPVMNPQIPNSATYTSLRVCWSLFSDDTVEYYELYSRPIFEDITVEADLEGTYDTRKYVRWFHSIRLWFLSFCPENKFSCRILNMSPQDPRLCHQHSELRKPNSLVNTAVTHHQHMALKHILVKRFVNIEHRTCSRYHICLTFQISKMN